MEEKPVMIKRLTSEHFLFMILAIMGLSLFTLRFMLAISFLPETGGVSINVLYGIQRITEGGNLYTSPETAPYPVIQYMPLHFYVIKGLALITGAGDSVHQLMVLNRLFCLATDLFTMLLLAIVLIRTFGIRPVIAWILALIYFACIPGIIYGRVDNLYLFFTLSTFVLVSRGLLKESLESNGYRFSWILPGITTGLAIATKQTGVFLAIFTGIYLLLYEKSFRKFLVYSSFSVFTLALVLLILRPGEPVAFYQNVVDGVKNGLNLNWFEEVLLKNYFLKQSYLIALGLMVAAIQLKNINGKQHFYLGAGILWFFTAATISCFKAGSGPNYFLEFILLTILAIGDLSRRFAKQIDSIMFYAVIISPFFLLASANDKGWGDTRNMKRAAADYENCREVATYINNNIKNDEWVLTGFHKENLLNIMLQDKALFPCREVALYFTLPLGVFHFSEFHTVVKNGKLRYLVLTRGKQPDSFIGEPMTDFRIEKTIGNYTVFSRH